MAGRTERVRIIVLLALVVGLDRASTGAVGAVALSLKQALRLDNTQIGLLVSTSTGIGIVATLAAGTLADRVNRVRVLWITVLIWAAAMGLGGLSEGYAWLLASRAALGVVVAVGGPAVASLIGDYFPPRERGRIYGFVLAAEGTCTAVGVLVSGWLAVINRRLGFFWLAAVGALLAVSVARYLPEPARRGQGWFPVTRTAPCARSGPMLGGRRRGVVAGEVMTQHVRPHPSLILRDDPRRRPLWWVIRYVLSVWTNVVLHRVDMRLRFSAVCEPSR